MTVIKLRGDTAANWSAVNPVLSLREPGVTTDTRVIKIGDGVTAWNDLDPVADLYPDWETVVLAAYQDWIDDGNTGTIEEYLADLVGASYGFVISRSSTPPASTTDVSGRPIIWIPDGSSLTPVPTTPTAPTWNLSTYTVTPPTVTGVQYELKDPVSGTWSPIPSGVATSIAGFTRPFLGVVRAQAKPGYVLTGAYSWSQLFYTASAFALWASDGFSGAAAALAPANYVAGRTWDMAGGGSASGAAIPKWFRAHVSLPSGWATDGSGKAIKNPADSASNNGNASIDTGASNWQVEIDVTAYPIRHSRTLQVYLGNPLNQSVRASAYLYINGTQGEVRFEGTGAAGRNDVYKTGVTEANMLGTWKFIWVNRILRVDAPDGQSFTYDFNPANQTYGTYTALHGADFGTAPAVFPTVDAIRVLK